MSADAKVLTKEVEVAQRCCGRMARAERVSAGGQAGRRTRRLRMQSNNAQSPLCSSFHPTSASSSNTKRSPSLSPARLSSVTRHIALFVTGIQLCKVRNCTTPAPQPATVSPPRSRSIKRRLQRNHRQRLKTQNRQDLLSSIFVCSIHFKTVNPFLFCIHFTCAIGTCLTPPVLGTS